MGSVTTKAGEVPDVPSADGAGETPSTDELYTVLANRRRRHALHYLKQRTDPVEIGELAERIAAWENDVAVKAVTGTERKRVYTALQQSHLPKMDDVGLVAFDKRRGVVEPASSLDDIEIYLDIVNANDVPWAEYYLGLSGVSIAFLAAVWVNSLLFSALSYAAVAAFVVTAFAVSAVIHVYSRRKSLIGGVGPPPEVSR